MRPALACLLSLSAAVALGAPPDLSEFPAEIKPAGQYATHVPKAAAAGVEYIGRSGVDAVPSAILKDGRVFLLDTRGLPPGRYDFSAVAASKTGELARKDFVVVVGNAPPKPGPGPKPGPDPDPKPDGDLGLRKVSRDGAATVPAAARSAHAAKLAGASRATASAVAAGGAGSTAATYLAAWRTGNNDSGADKAAWAPWATAASDGLQAAYKGGKLAAARDWAAAFNELADGLDDAGGN